MVLGLFDEWFWVFRLFRLFRFWGERLAGLVRVSTVSPRGVGANCLASLEPGFAVVSQQGIVLLEGRVVTVRLFVVLSGLPLTGTRFQSRIFCFTAGIIVGLYRGGLYASDALLALLSIFSGRRFLTSQPYFRLG